ncbi:MAG: hypothetical protein ACI9Y1_002814 [Lentisphaeria bacterium]|jgi:hypothetical protein
MLIRFILATAVIAFIVWQFNKIAKLPQKARRDRIIHVLFYAAIGLTIVAALMGRLHWVGALIAGLIGFGKFSFGAILRALPFLNFLRKNPVFGNPVFKTPYLEVCLNLQQGQLTGTIMHGLHEGRTLQSLNSEEIKELQNFYQDKDKRSFYLMRALQQRASTSFNKDEQPFSSVGEPSIQEALQILGLQENPDKQDIIKAHRSLIQKLHPDRGGNDYLASRVNVAKKVLLRHFYP